MTAILENFGFLNSFGTSTSVFRTFRIIRVLRLIKEAKSIRIIFMTFIFTLPALVNIGGLLCICLFMFSLLGMNFYPYLKWGEGVKETINFTSFYNSFWTLFKSAGGEDWNLILADTVRRSQPDDVCFEISTYEEYLEYGLNGCGGISGYFFIIIYQLLIGMIMLNLFVAVVLQGFDNLTKHENSPVKPFDMEKFTEVWQNYDPKATKFIKARKLPFFLLTLPKPLGWEERKLSLEAQRHRIKNFELQVFRKHKHQETPYYYMYDVLIALVQDFLIRDKGWDAK